MARLRIRSVKSFPVFTRQSWTFFQQSVRIPDKWGRCQSSYFPCSGLAIIGIGDAAKPLADVISVCSQAMFKIVNMILGIIPFGVFGLMSVSLLSTASIFGPVLKFILTDYLASIIMCVVVYSIFLIFIAKVSPIKFWKKAFEPWMIAFSTCTSSAALPVSMEVAPKKMGVPKDIASFVLPLGATANMNGTCIYFGIIVLFAAQLYGIDLSVSQQIMLVVQATFLSVVGCAATRRLALLSALRLHRWTSTGSICSGSRYLQNHRPGPYIHQLRWRPCNCRMYLCASG